MTAQEEFEKQLKSINQTRNQTIKKINHESNKAEFAYVLAFYKNHILSQLNISNKTESKMVQLIIQVLDILNKNYSTSAASKRVMILKLINQYKALLDNAYIAVINNRIDPKLLAKNPLEYPHYEEIDLDHLDEYTEIIQKFDNLNRQNTTQKDIEKWRKVINKGWFTWIKLAKKC